MKGVGNDLENVFRAIKADGASWKMAQQPRRHMAAVNEVEKELDGQEVCGRFLTLPTAFTGKCFLGEKEVVQND